MHVGLQLLHCVVNVVGLVAVAATPVTASDWPQYRGPNHNGVSTDRVRTNWAAVPPSVIWRKPLNTGFGSLAVSQGKVLTLVTADGACACVALDAATGDQLWSRAVDDTDYGGGGPSPDGPHATPTIDGDRVYVLTHKLKLWCLDLGTGSSNWVVDLQLGGGVTGWNAAASPLVVGNHIFVNNNRNSGNKSLLAINKSTGSLVWSNANDRMTHATPAPAVIAGVTQIVFYAQSGLVSVNPSTGAVLWRAKADYNTSVAISPVISSNTVFASLAYGNNGRSGFDIFYNGSAWTTSRLYRVNGDANGNHWSTPVVVDGCLYGFFGTYDNCQLKCVDMRAGTNLWTGANFGPGGIVVADGKLLLQSETGGIVLVKPDRTGYREIARLNAMLSGVNWNSPAICDGRLYARSSSEAICLDIGAPFPSTTGIAMQTGQHVNVRFQGGSGVGYEVFATTNFTTGIWTNLGAATEQPPGSGQYLLIDSNAAALPAKFYRVR